MLADSAASNGECARGDSKVLSSKVRKRYGRYELRLVTKLQFIILDIHILSTDIQYYNNYFVPYFIFVKLNVL